jgi:WS/DGAT/MGAT family acyltransferase
MRTISSALSSAAPVLMQPAPPTPFNRPVSGDRSYASLPMSFAEIREVRSALGGTLNDVVLTTLAGGLGAYLRGLGERTDGVDLRAMVPVNVRQPADKSALGNQVSLLIAQLPVGITDPVARHRTLMTRMDGLKKANQAGGFALLSRLAENVPPVMQAFAGNFVPNGQQLFNLICTNVPGPQIPLYLAGRRFEDLRPLVPISMGLGLNVALTSYDGALYWGICADPNLVPHVQHVADCLWQSFEELRATARSAAPA